MIAIVVVVAVRRSAILSPRATLEPVKKVDQSGIMNGVPGRRRTATLLKDWLEIQLLSPVEAQSDAVMVTVGIVVVVRQISEVGQGGG